MPFFYRVYGLHLCASLAIPGLVGIPATQAVDVQVYLGFLPEWLHEAARARQDLWCTSPYHDEGGEPTSTIWKLACGAYFRLRYSDGTEFVIDRAGTAVWATWPDPLTLEDTATYLTGPVLGFVLCLRGMTCLHASAVAIGDRAIALVGAAEAGKSTTAAALAELGYPVLSDDVVPLQDAGETFLALPGYAYLRLWPVTVNALYGSSEALPRLTPNWEKCYLDLTAPGYQFQREPLPLAAIYVLGERHASAVAPCITAMAGHAGLITLIGNTYANLLLDPAMRARELELLGRVMAHVPLRRLTPHTDLTHLARLCQTILDDFRVLSGSLATLKGAGKVDHV